MRAIELVVSWLLTYALHSTLLLGAAWALARWVVRSHAAREALWKAALLGGVLTATLQLAAGFEPLAGRFTISAQRAAASAPTGDRDGSAASLAATTTKVDARSNIDREGARDAPAAGQRSTVAGESSTAAPPATAAKTTVSWNVLAAFVASWALVALVLLARFVAAHVQLFLRVGPRVLVRDDHLVELVDLLREEAGMARPVRLTRAAGLPSPIALGRAEICLPDAALDELDREQQESMLAHEVAHLRRRDPAWLLAAGTIERLLFFQPLNRLARRRLQEHAEYLCDDWAARRNGSGVTLAKCLLKVAEWIDAAADPLPLAGMAEMRSHFVSRIDRLVANRALSARPRGRWLLPASVAAIAAVAAAAPGITAGDWPLVAARSGLLPGGLFLPEALAHGETEGGTVTRPQTSAQPAHAGSAAAAALIGALGDEDAGVRAAAAQSLGNRRETAAVPALVAAVRDPEAAVRANAVEALAEMHDSRAFPGFIAALGDDNPHVRKMAVEAVGEHQVREAAPRLVALLQDGDADVRQHAAQALGELRHVAAAPALAALLADRQPDVRRAAASALGELGLEQAPPQLLDALRDPAADVRQEAAQAVGEMRDARAVPALVALLDDAKADVRHTAIEALSEIRDAAAIDALVRAMKAKDPEVRRRAADALGERN
ncbi:MAG TPA: M56 family metallopeptidase [Thermoanaerobaculia bacterium]|jgi:HEAT repeat protein/beta-lactamase regulating signal transducer with metallopeptidase domain|nr:M56 family metallopeptidase [Thermoanaerobaculia bacterium]